MVNQDETAKKWRDQGFTAGQAAHLAAELGWSPVETIKALKKQFGISVGSAKGLVDKTLDGPSRIATEYFGLQALLAARVPPSATEEDLAELEANGWNLKLFALVRAGRHNDAVAAIERFEPRTLRIRPLRLPEARQLVEESISTWPTPMQIMEDVTQEHSFGWSFGCQSVAYATSGDFLDMVVGHGPFLVDRTTGVLWSTGSALSLERSVRNYLATGDPHVAPEDDSAS